MKPLVVIPTYNERENIQLLISKVLSLNSDVNILVVDDSSPDGTGNLVLDLKKTEPRVHLLSREKKEGLGRAYLAGFDWGLKKDYDSIIEMDADFSHRPEDLVLILEKIKSTDFVVGSRYVSGGRTVNWSWLRLLISRGGIFIRE